MASLLAVAVYALGLSGGFYFDDEWNILRNQALQLDSMSIEGLWNASMSGTSGPLGRPLSMLSFALNHIVFGLDPFFFKLVNLAIHLLCGWAIYALALALCEHLPRVPERRQHLFAFLVMLLWLLHPLNLTTVLYSVQRMAGLSALFCLLGMLAYVKARQVKSSARALRAGLYVSSFLVFWPLAMASKENAVLFPAYLFLIELVFLKFRVVDRDKISRNLVLTYCVLLIVPTIFLSVYFLIYPDWMLNSFARRDFTLSERVLTQSRVLLFYIGQTFVPMNGSLGLFHDDFVLSKSILAPWTTLASVAALIIALTGALASVKKYPVIAFAILFFLAAHALESTVFGLELVHEHRNYLAIFSLLFAVAYYLVVGSEKFLSLRAVAAVCLVLFFGATTLTRAVTWGEPVVHAITEAENHPSSPRANYGVGKKYAVYASYLDDSPQKTEALEKAVYHFRKSSELRWSYTDGLFGMLMIEGLEGYEMGEENFQSLVNRLATAAFSNNNYNYLHALLACMEKGDCEISDRKLSALIDACLSNPGFAGGHRSSIIDRYQAFLK